MSAKPERVAISAAGTTVQDEMDHHFGRCGFFVIAEAERITAIGNTARDAAEGAGLNAAQLMIDHGVDVVITGSLGPKASDVLEEAGIRTYIGPSGRIEDVLRQYREGRLEASTPGLGGRTGH
jgi:predicted Fe-Mo cluster-binding NifX family protein